MAAFRKQQTGNRAFTWVEQHWKLDPKTPTRMHTSSVSPHLMPQKHVKASLAIQNVPPVVSMLHGAEMVGAGNHLRWECHAPHKYSR